MRHSRPLRWPHCLVMLTTLTATCSTLLAESGVITAEELIRIYSSSQTQLQDPVSDPMSTSPVTRGIGGVRNSKMSDRATLDGISQNLNFRGNDPNLGQLPRIDTQTPAVPDVRINLSARQSFDNILFASGSSTIEADSYRQLDELGVAMATLMSGNPTSRFIVEGHTDSAGGHQFNQQLSRSRAQAIRSFLVARHGLDPARIEIVGHGDRYPVATNDTEAGRRMNRRVVIAGTS